MFLRRCLGLGISVACSYHLTRVGWAPLTCRDELLVNMPCIEFYPSQSCLFTSLMVFLEFCPTPPNTFLKLCSWENEAKTAGPNVVAGSRLSVEISAQAARPLPRAPREWSSWAPAVGHRNMEQQQAQTALLMQNTTLVFMQFSVFTWKGDGKSGQSVRFLYLGQHRGEQQRCSETWNVNT